MERSLGQKKAPEIRNEVSQRSHEERMAEQMPNVERREQIRDEKKVSARGIRGLGNHQSHRASEHG